MQKNDREITDATVEMLDIATWVRGFYLALLCTGFTTEEAMRITESAVTRLLNMKAL